MRPPVSVPDAAGFADPVPLGSHLSTHAMHFLSRMVGHERLQHRRKSVAGHIFHDLGGEFWIGPRTATDKHIDGVDDLAVHLRLLSQEPDVRDQMVSAPGWTTGPMQRDGLEAIAQLALQGLRRFDSPAFGFDDSQIAIVVPTQLTRPLYRADGL